MDVAARINSAQLRVPRHSLTLPKANPALTVTSRSRRSCVSVQAAAQASAVKLIIQGRRLLVTDAIKGYIEQKIQRAVHNFSHTLKEVDVTVSARGGDTGTKGPKEQKVDVTIYTLKNGVVRVEDSEADLYASIDLVCDKLERKLRKLKEKAIAKGKWPGRAGPHIDVGGQAFQEHIEQVIYDTRVLERERQEAQLAAINREFPAAVVRSKVVGLERQSVEDAIESLEALGHDFYVFQEKESGAVQVLYKRKEEGYGLLMPKVA